MISRGTLIWGHILRIYPGFRHSLEARVVLVLPNNMQHGFPGGTVEAGHASENREAVARTVWEDLTVAKIGTEKFAPFKFLVVLVEHDPQISARRGVGDEVDDCPRSGVGDIPLDVLPDLGGR